MEITLKRVYEQAVRGDGYRVLVDRLWPRGFKKENLHIDEWCKDIAPSPELRDWFHKDLSRFDEFAVRYEEELSDSPACQDLLNRASGTGSKITLVYASKDPVRNHAAVLRNYLAGQQ